MAEDWQSQKFRQNVIGKINEMLQSTGQDPSKNASVMENHIFKKSRTKDEYLGLVAKLYMHFKDLARKPQQAPPPPNAEMSQQNMMQDPLNALQNLASQGNRNPPMMPVPGGVVPNPNQSGQVAASNLLQTLSQQRPGQQTIQQMQGIRMGAGVVSGPGQGVQGTQMGAGMLGAGMQMNVMGGPGQQQAQQMGGIPGQMNQIGGAAQMGVPGQMNQMGVTGPVPAGPGVVPNQMQMTAGPMQGGPPMNVNAMNVNAMNVQQMQQMNQNQMNMGINHAQLNQMMSARMGQVGPNINVGPNAPSMGMPPNMQQNPGGPMHPNNVAGTPQASGAGMGINAAQQGNLNQMLTMQQKSNMTMAQGGQVFSINRGVGGVGGVAGGVSGQQQFLRQSPTPAVPSPVGMTVAQQQQHLQQQQQIQQQQQQQQQLTQISNPQMIPSPALTAPSPSAPMSNLMQNSQRNMRQSPLNTPGQVLSNSPLNPQEDQLYREKYKQLTKYIEPLKRMVAKIGNDGTNAEKITKMSKLLEILSNPAQRVPLETLLKCEKALEKMELVSYSGQQFGKSSNPLLEVINTTLQSPIANHTLNRTFRPTLDLLFGTDICAPIPPKRQRVAEKITTQFEHDIPHVLQGEIARLDQKFKVTLDATVQNNNKSIRLLCCLDDKRLPSVPPVSVNIPEEYPWTSPDCALTEQEYSATPFLKAVLNALTSRIAKLPKCYSLSHLLDTWEMAVRQACAPNTNAKTLCDFTTLFNV